jgi:hypothetical protein
METRKRSQKEHAPKQRTKRSTTSSHFVRACSSNRSVVTLRCERGEDEAEAEEEEEAEGAAAAVEAEAEAAVSMALPTKSKQNRCV